MMGNSFKPFFVGHFEQRADAVYLTGRFTMLWVIKAFMTVWFGFLLVFVLASAAMMVGPRSGALPALLGSASGL
jgi:hypothetical protein